MTRRPLNSGWPFASRPPLDRRGWLASPCWRDPPGADPTRSMYDDRPRAAWADRPEPAAPAIRPASSGSLFPED